MGHVSSPRDDRNEIPVVVPPDFDGFSIVEASDQRFRQFGQARHIAPRSPLDADDAELNSPTAPPTLAGRADIDIAMVEALRLAMDLDHGRGALEWKTPEQMQFDDERRSGGRGAISSVPPPLAVRPGPDTAVVEGLRHAMDSNPETPGA
jgi:hypothetical protein